MRCAVLRTRLRSIFLKYALCLTYAHCRPHTLCRKRLESAESRAERLAQEEQLAKALEEEEDEF